MLMLLTDLSPVTQKAVTDAIAEIEYQKNFKGNASQFFVYAIPARLQHEYSTIFKRKLYKTFLRVSQRLRNGEDARPTCIAEQLVLKVIFEDAKISAMNIGKLLNTVIYELDNFSKNLNGASPVDVIPLFDMELIKDNEELERKLKNMNLRFKDWFKPFDLSARLDFESAKMKPKESKKRKIFK